jgi:hypothetical protein
VAATGRRRLTRRAHGAAAVLAASALLVGGCSEDLPRGVATYGPDDPVLLTTGIRYAQAPDGWRDPTLDLYVPADAGDPPLVVVVPEPGADPAVYDALARDVADRGVAAAVVRWGVEDPALVTLAGRPADDVVAQVEQVDAEIGCALAAAAAQAGPGVGSPSRPLLVVGHGSGANAAGMAALTPVERFPGCFAPEGSPHVAAALLWDGDWLGAVAGDSLGPDTARFLAAYSPWPSVDTMPTTTYVEAGVNANRLEGQAVQAWPGSEYLTTRDPTGELTSDLRDVDAFADGAIDPVDVTRAFAVGMGNGEVVNREREVHGEGDPDTMGPRVRALVVESVVQLSRSP